MMPRLWPYGSTSQRPWDDGIRWHLEQSADEGPDWSKDPLQLPFVRDQHLRAAGGAAEDAYIDWLIKASYRQAERRTQRTLIPQTRRMVLTGFPWGDIFAPYPPLISVSGIAYLDAGGTEQELAGSPSEFDVDAPSGATAKRGRIRPLNGSSWPSTRSEDGAVVVTFMAGYPVGEDGYASIPEDINDGRLLWIGERYKQRSLSVHAFNQNDAVIRAHSIWMDYRVY